MNTMIAKAATLTTAELKKLARDMSESAEAYAVDLMMAALVALESKLPEAEYVEFCGSI